MPDTAPAVRFERRPVNRPEVPPLLLKETPQARLKDNAPTAVSTAELVTVVTGAKAAKSAALLQRFDGSLRSMRLDFTPVAQPGTEALTEMQSLRLLAALELGRRMEAECRPGLTVGIRSPRDVAEHCRDMEELPVEQFHLLALDAQHRLVKNVLVTRGLLNSSLVHPREVFREAIKYRAAAIILVHNHPSGDPTPSSDDRVVTEQLVQAGRVLDIPVQDHIIIGHGGSYTSFAEAGLL